MTTLRWMGAPESEVKMVEAMYENTKARVLVGSRLERCVIDVFLQLNLEERYSTFLRSEHINRYRNEL